MIKDPWTVSTSNLDQSTTAISGFEDNFEPFPSDPDSLPDSREYLEALEKKLEKLHTNSNILQELADRREHCLASLLRGSITLPTDIDCGLLDGSDSDLSESRRGSEIVRHIIPEQPTNPGELVHIIKFDQLEQLTSSTSDTDSDQQETASQ